MKLVRLGSKEMPDVNTGIEKKSRKEVAKALSRVLADTYALQLKTLYYHWNVTGPLFESLHEMFGQHYADISPAVDEIAERIRGVGHIAPGTYREFSTLASIREDKELPENWQTMVENLLAAHETVARSCRQALRVVEKAGDDVSVDLMVRRMEYHEKTAWMLRSVLG